MCHYGGQLFHFGGGDSCKLSAPSSHNLRSHARIGSPGLYWLCFPNSLSYFWLPSACIWGTVPSGTTMLSSMPQAPNPLGESKTSQPSQLYITAAVLSHVLQWGRWVLTPGSSCGLHQLLGLSSFARRGPPWTSGIGNRKKIRVASGRWDMLYFKQVVSPQLFNSTFYTGSNKRGFLKISDISVTQNMRVI